MFKKISFIFLLAISISGLFFGGKYVYDRQAYQLNFSSFSISPKANGLYIPNVKIFYELNIENSLFNLPLEVNVGKTKVLAFLKKNAVTDELYLSYDEQNYSVAIKQNSFDSDKFIVFLDNQLDIDVDKEAGLVKIGSKIFYYFMNNDFFVFSTLKIVGGTTSQFERPKGNYHYLIQQNLKPKQQFFKHNKNEIYSFYTNESNLVKGKPIAPSLYYNTIPSNFDTLRFYGSDRVLNDLQSLIEVNSNTEFFSWIDNSIIHLKKDSLEILIGLQNDFQNLSNMLDEETILLSKDSLLPPSIFKNNYEIHKFESSYRWGALIPFTEAKFNYYSEFNNFNVLGNSESAMNWFITELQLGNVFSTKSKSFHHPKNVHQLTISQTELTHHLVSKNWSKGSDCFVSEVWNKSGVENNSPSLPLISTFPVNIENFKIKSFIFNDTLEVLLFNDEKIISYNEVGEVNWTKELKSPLISFPIEVQLDSIACIVLFMKNAVDVIDENNLSKDGFPFQFNSVATTANVIQNVSGFSLLVKIENGIIKVNENGETPNEWPRELMINELKSDIEIGTMNKKTIISYVDVNDSLFVMNEFGAPLFSSNISLFLKHKSNFMSTKEKGQDLRMYGFSNPFIISQLVNTGQIDSLRINYKLQPTSVNWVEHKNSAYLVIEEYDRVMVFNEFGLLEKEVQKPRPNLKLITTTFFYDDFMIFYDFKNKKLYLLDSYGRNICEYPVLGESNFDINYKSIVVYFNSKIYIYSLKTF
jgi:hypothetical protein